MAGLDESVYAELDRLLTPVDALRLTRYPGEWPQRQPVHTCYVPADAVVPGLAAAWGSAALEALDEHGLPDLGLDPELVEDALPRVRAKLAAEPVEDLRVDAEDGYRGTADHEDDDVLRAASRPGPPRRRSASAASRSRRRPVTAASGPWTSSWGRSARTGPVGPSSPCRRSPMSTR